MNILSLFRRKASQPIRVGSECTIQYATTTTDGTQVVSKEPGIVRKIFKNGHVSLYLYRVGRTIRCDINELTR